MIIVAFGAIDPDGNVKIPDNFGNFKKLRTPSTKLILSLGGAKLEAKNSFAQFSSKPETRANFVKNCLNVVKNNNLDGIDIVWEYPEPADRENFVALHQDLKQE